MPIPTITFPTVHLNGTGRRTLLEDNVKCALAIGAALDRIQKSEFNARDYYVQGDQAFRAATNQRNEHIYALMKAKEYFNTIAEHVADRIEERSPTR